MCLGGGVEGVEWVGVDVVGRLGDVVGGECRGVGDEGDFSRVEGGDTWGVERIDCKDVEERDNCELRGGLGEVGVEDFGVEGMEGTGVEAMESLGMEAEGDRLFAGEVK